MLFFLGILFWAPKLKEGIAIVEGGGRRDGPGRNINNIFWCTIYARFQTWPWTNCGQAIERPIQGVERPIYGVERYLERGQGYQKFQFLSAFCYSSIFVGSCRPKKGNNLGFDLDTLDGTRIQKYTVSRLLYLWSLVRSFVVYLKSLASELYPLGLLTFRVYITYAMVRLHGNLMGLRPSVS